MTDDGRETDMPTPVRFRFRLRTLMAVVTVLSVLLAIPYFGAVVWYIIGGPVLAVVILAALMLVQYPMYLGLKRLQNPAHTSTSHSELQTTRRSGR